MKKKNVLKDFIDYSISKNESEAIKGGRANNPINTGSYGFINWDDIDVRGPGLVSSIGQSISAIKFSKKLG